MDNSKIAITGFDLVSAYGLGLDKCWDGVFFGETAVSRLERFSTEQFASSLAATVPGLTYHGGDSLVWQMLKTLRPGYVPENAYFFLATTVGEIDLLEKSILAGNEADNDSHQLSLLEKCLTQWNIREGRLINAACASATLAIARGAAMIEAGKTSCAVIAAADSVSEFVFSGFSALGAMSPETARPFDEDRSGLSLGEAAGVIILMSESEAEKCSMPIYGYLTGWGGSCDARHMTKPDESGKYLAEAVRKALTKADSIPGNIGAIMAHGTGTLYNDEMELAAMKTVFSNSKVPMISSKFGTGHTLGAAGIVQAGLALKTLETKMVPAQGNITRSMEGAENFIFSEAQSLNRENILSINAGFGGINAALVFQK